MAGWVDLLGNELATRAKQDAQQVALDAIAVSADSTATDADAIRLAAQSIDNKTPALIGGESPMADAQLRTRIGNTTDAEVAAGDGTVIALLKRARTLLSNIATSVAGTLNISGTVTVSNLPGTQPVSGSVGITNFPATQPISAAALPLPAGAATETTLAAVNAKLPDLDSGRVPVVLPPGSSGLTDFELRAQALAVAAPAGASPLADNDKLMRLLEGLAYLAHTIEHVNGANGAWAATGPAQRVSLNAAQPLGVVAQVSAVAALNNQVADGGVPTNNNVYNVALANERALMVRI